MFVALKKLALGTLLIAGVAATSLSARAAELSIAIVDVQAVMVTSDASKKLQKELKAEQEKLHKEFEAKRAKLQEKERSIKSKISSMPPEKLQAEREAFEKTLFEAQRDVQSKKRKLDESVAAAMSEMRGKLLKIVQEISEEKGYQIVLTRQDVVLADKSLDITPTVLEQFNKTVKTVKLK